MRTRVWVAGAAVVALVTPLAPAAAAPPRDDRFPTAPAGVIDTDLIPAALDDQRTVRVIVELADDPVAVVEAAQPLDRTARNALRTRLANSQRDVVRAVEQAGGSVTAQMQDAYNGVSASIPRSAVSRLADLPGVTAVHAAPVATRSTTTSLPYLGVPEAWESTGYTGAGIKMAIIDSGIDYTHADFGGPGTTEAFLGAFFSSTLDPDPALVGPDAPRIKGGYDFVGDSYDASLPGSLPEPDPNPLDCSGHGTHVAGIAAGSGVRADDTTYSGPYDTSTGSRAFSIGPGVAPEVDIYALRVLGCAGATNLTTEAIDWAVQHDMDVINMSLSSPYGAAEDPTSVAAANAVAAGIVVVAAVGNNGPSPYLAGAPAVGHGVVSVAANDPVAGFPAFAVALPGGDSLTAMSITGLASAPEAPLRLVVLADDPDTEEDESLGCRRQDYTANGIVPGGDQLAVTGILACDALDRSLAAQEAGAAALAMVNADDTRPAYEGPLTGATDDPSAPVEVTIPVLGIAGPLGADTGSDGDRLVGADGAQVTLSATTPLPNPASGRLAPFSSSGPALVDSGIAPSVVAPGVSIVSAVVGSGSGGASSSGTSMAAPHVAGTAALAVQAHPDWPADAIAATLVNTADPQQVTDGTTIRAGAGLIDPADALAAVVTATGDTSDAHGVTVAEPTLSFGFVEDNDRVTRTRRITVTNHGDTTARYAVTVEPAPTSRPARVRTSASRITVRPGQTKTFTLRLSVPMNRVGSTLDGTPFAFHEVSGSVVLTGPDTLRVPYLLVPRAEAKVDARARKFTSRSSAVTVTLSNRRGALDAQADFYELGLTDPRGDADTAVDLRAVGVQSFREEGEDDALVVFAVNAWNRTSNAAALETGITVDTNDDAAADYVVFALDAGLLNVGRPDGRTGVFVYDVSAGTVAATGQMAVAPTDNSTVLLPVPASALGLDESSGPFGYAAYAASLRDDAAYDQTEGWAHVDPWRPALATGMNTTVDTMRSSRVRVAIDPEQFAQTEPGGIMVVVHDNAAGAAEARLLKPRR
ncbi:MAG: S8 family serine peptidase [Propioniciclava sp.]